MKRENHTTIHSRWCSHRMEQSSPDRVRIVVNGGRAVRTISSYQSQHSPALPHSRSKAAWSANPSSGSKVDDHGARGQPEHHCSCARIQDPSTHTTHQCAVLAPNTPPLVLPKHMPSKALLRTYEEKDFSRTLWEASARLLM